MRVLLIALLAAISYAQTDTTAPVVTLNGESSMKLSQGGSYSELGAVSDGGEEITIIGTVNPDVHGTYILTYTATDEAGNVGTATREVIVAVTITFELTVQGVTDENKLEVCEAFATDLGGTMKYCDFSRSTRRLLNGASKLYVDIGFPDEVTTTAAETKVAQDGYLDSLTMPSGVTVTSMKEAQPIDCNQCGADVVAANLCYCMDEGEDCDDDLHPASCDDSCEEQMNSACAATRNYVPSSPCGSTAHGDTESRTYYSLEQVNAPESCQSETQTRTCDNGSFDSWSGSYAYESCKVMEDFARGTCMPSGQYELAECCPEGYTQIGSDADCQSAFEYLGSGNEFYGGTGDWPNLPTGCFRDTSSDAFHYNPTNAIGNSVGRVEVICKHSALDNRVTALEMDVAELLIVNADLNDRLAVLEMLVLSCKNWCHTDHPEVNWNRKCTWRHCGGCTPCSS